MTPLVEPDAGVLADSFDDLAERFARMSALVLLGKDVSEKVLSHRLDADEFAFKRVDTLLSQVVHPESSVCPRNSDGRTGALPLSMAIERPQPWGAA